MKLQLLFWALSATLTFLAGLYIGNDPEAKYKELIIEYYKKRHKNVEELLALTLTYIDYLNEKHANSTVLSSNRGSKKKQRQNTKTKSRHTRNTTK